MSTEQQPEAPTPAPEEWQYGGLRLDKTTPHHVWITDAGAGAELWYSAKSGRYVVGNIYRVLVSRPADKTRMHGEPTYERRGDDPAKVAELEAAHRVTQAIQERQRRERKAEAQSELDAALEPLVTIARTLRTGAQRDAFAAHVLRKLSREWS